MMATSGEETTPDSESYYETFCSPCQSDGKRLAAVWSCETCKASLCELCFDCHTVPIPMRNHRLLKMEQTAVENEVNKDPSQCPKHEGETVLYHCHTHSFLGCYTCFSQHRKTCRETKYIPYLSETLSSHFEFKEFFIKLKYITKISNHLVEECKSNITLVEKCHTEAIAAIKAIKLELLEAIDQLERELYAKAEAIMQEGISELNSIIDTCFQYQPEIQAITTEIETLQNQNRKNDRYISVVKSKNRLLSLETELNAAKGKPLMKCFKFDVNEETREALNSPFGLGKLRIMTDVVKAEHIKDINVKCQEDKRTCAITSSVVIPEHRLVIADYNNNNLKVLDTKQQKVLSAMTLTSAPCSLAKVTDITVAATLPNDKKIVFVKTDPTLSIDKELAVDGYCYGVAYNKRDLVVGFSNPHKVEIMGLAGAVFRTIQTDGNGEALFNNPYCVAVNPECRLIYVSNYSSHNVVCLRFDGTVAATYKDNELQYPRQAIVDSTGNVFVCGYGPQNIHQMTVDCQKITVLLTSNDGLSQPFTISFEETEGNLYVGQNNDNVKVYQIVKECL